MDIEELIFNMYKSQPLVAKKFKEKVMKKYHITLDEARNIFVKINNYQIKKYGKKLDELNELLPYSKEELNKIRSKANQRKYDKRRRTNGYKESYI